MYGWWALDIKGELAGSWYNSQKKNKFAIDVKVYQKAMMVPEIYFSSKVVYTR